MWDRGREELIHLGISPESWLYGWEKRIERGDAVAWDHAILGCDWEPGAINTSFQATKDFERPEIGRRITRDLRRAIPKLMKERGANRVHVYSLCVAPDAEKWFRVLGLREDATFKPQLRGPYTLRRFWRTA